MDKQQFQVVIVGGGCAGLWLLHELSTRKFPSVLIEHGSLGAYASTRNQSWLHSGALYAIGTNTPVSIQDASASASLTTGRKCVQAFQEMLEFCPTAFGSGSKCLFAFKDEKELELASQGVAALGISAQNLTLANLLEREPLLFTEDGTFKFGLATPDVPFDSHAFLSHLAGVALQEGGIIKGSERELAQLEIIREDSSWTVKDNKSVIEAQVLICASGALTPRIMSHLNVPPSEFKIQKCLVLVLHQRVCDHVVSLRDAGVGDLNLVPFKNGTTVNLGGTDEIAFDHADEHFDQATYADVLEAVGRFVPGLKHAEAHFYVCQKLNNSDFSSHGKRIYGNRHYFWVEEQKSNLYFFYPGKFTLAKIGACELVDHIASLYVPSGLPPLPQPTLAPSITSAYEGEATDVLVRTGTKTLRRDRLRT